MDMLRMRQYLGMRPRTKSSGLYDGLDGGGASAKPLSKLDDARLKFSKYKLKYGKQEKQIHEDSPLSSTDLSSSEASPTVNSLLIPVPKTSTKEPSENSNLAENINVLGSENINSDSLMKAPDRKLNQVNYSEQEYLPEVGLISENFVQSRNKNSGSDSSVSEIHENIRSFSSLEIQSWTQNEDVSLKSVQDSFISHNAAPADILERKTSITSVSSITDTLESEQKVGQTVQSQIAPVAAVQETSRNVSSVAESEQTSSRSEHSSNKLPDRVSSLSLISLERKPKQRDAKVQTDRKRTRTIQVSLSDASDEKRIGTSCPVLRASSLPRGLRSNDDPSEYIAENTKTAVQLLLNSQMKLTLNLLRREQALYVNCSRSAARLERGYQRHTLSDTRQFIRRERKLREKLRRNAE